MHSSSGTDASKRLALDAHFPDEDHSLALESDAPDWRSAFAKNLFRTQILMINSFCSVNQKKQNANQIA